MADPLVGGRHRVLVEGDAETGCGRAVDVAVAEREGRGVGEVVQQPAAAAVADAQCLFLDEGELGPAGAVIKLGAEGAFALLDRRSYRQPAVPVTVHHSVGAGDAFAAGYLAELLAGRPPERRLRTAALLGAFAVSTTGDWEGLPRRSELGLLDHHDDIVR